MEENKSEQLGQRRGTTREGVKTGVAEVKGSLSVLEEPGLATSREGCEEKRKEQPGRTGQGEETQN